MRILKILSRCLIYQSGYRKTSKKSFNRCQYYDHTQNYFKHVILARCVKYDVEHHTNECIIRTGIVQPNDVHFAPRITPPNSGAVQFPRKL